MSLGIFIREGRECSQYVVSFPLPRAKTNHGSVGLSNYPRGKEITDHELILYSHLMDSCPMFQVLISGPIFKVPTTARSMRISISTPVCLLCRSRDQLRASMIIAPTTILRSRSSHLPIFNAVRTKCCPGQSTIQAGPCATLTIPCQQ